MTVKRPQADSSLAAWPWASERESLGTPSPVLPLQRHCLLPRPRCHHPMLLYFYLEPYSVIQSSCIVDLIVSIVHMIHCAGHAHPLRGRG